MTAYSSKLFRVRSTSSTDATFPSRVPTATQPSGAGVVDDPITQGAPDWIQVIPYGSGSHNDTFDLRVLGWKVTALGLWVPTILAQAGCTLSATTVGVNSYEVTASQRFADRITLTQVLTNVDSKLSNVNNDTVASFQVQTRGVTLIEIIFDLGTATDANALVAWV